MSLQDVKPGDWIKIQVTEIDDRDIYPIKTNCFISFTKDGELFENSGEMAFPLDFKIL